MAFDENITSLSELWEQSFTQVEICYPLNQLSTGPDLLVPIQGTIDDIAFSPGCEQGPQPTPIESPYQTTKTRMIWTKQEDQLLYQLVYKYKKVWFSIQKHFPSKKFGSAQKRWKTKLDPKLKKHKWTNQEDEKIVQLYARHGGNWKLIGQMLPGRQSDNIKNRFYGTIQKKKQVESKRKIPKRVRKMNNFQSLESVDVFERFQESNLLAECSKNLQRPVNQLTVMKSLKSLPAEEKRRKLKDLYARMASLEAIIGHTREQMGVVNNDTQ